MSKQKRLYEILVHYPESEQGLLELRKQTGKAFSIVLREYIFNLNISDSQKEELYIKLTKQLARQIED